MDLIKITEEDKKQMLKEKREPLETLTKKEKLQLAIKLRENSVISFEPTEEYKEYLDNVECQEKYIETRKDKTHIYIISPKDLSQKKGVPLFIHMHGGGFVRGYYGKRDMIFCSRIATALQCKVVDIDYKLAPEYPFPIALEECYDIVKWIFEHTEILNVNIENIAIGGDSAGGNFAAAICLLANQNKKIRFKYQILDYAYLDAVTDPADKIDENHFFPVNRARAFNQLYLEHEDDKNNIYVSPVQAGLDMLAGLPPTLFIIPGLDFLSKEQERYASMLFQAGVEVKIKKFLQSNHGFTVSCKQEYEGAQKLLINTLGQAFYGRHY